MGNKIKTIDISQQLDLITGNNTLENTPIFETGNFSSSHSMLSTAFKDGDALFQTMKDYRATVANRLSNETGAPISGFGENSQQVLLPAFMAAYSGKNPNKVNT